MYNFCILKLFFAKMRFKGRESERRIIYYLHVYKRVTGLKNAKNAKCGHISQRSRTNAMKKTLSKRVICLYVYVRCFGFPYADFCLQHPIGGLLSSGFSTGTPKNVYT